MSTTAEIQDVARFEGVLADLRSDSSPVNWMLSSHVDGNPNLVACVGSGTGGPTEMAQLLSDSEVMYGLVRLQEQVDMSETVKFVYIHWVGEKVPSIKKGRFGVVHGSVKEKLGRAHHEIETSHREDLTEEEMMRRLTDTSGTKSKEIDKEVAAKRQDRGFTSSSNVIKTGKAQQSVQAPKGVDVKMDPAVQEAVADVRSDDSPTNWCVAGYEGKNPKSPVVLLGKGTEGLDGIACVLDDDAVGYGLLRVTDVVDEIVTVKFVFITWVGERVKPMTKGKISTHKSTMDKYFSVSFPSLDWLSVNELYNYMPAHIVIHATTKADLSEQDIMAKVQSASGSKSHVK